MEYQLIAEIVPPADTAELDALQRLGVATLLDEQLDQLAAVEGPDGVEIEPVDHSVEVRASGAVITWALDAPALVLAEDGARHVLDELLDRTQLLTDWTVSRCEVSASDEDLAAAFGDDEQPVDADDEDEETEEPTAEELAAAREQLLASADQLRAFGLEAFGHVPDDEESVSAEQATLVAGAFVQGIEVLTDELFQDIQALEEAEVTAGEQDTLWVLDQLPERFADQYTALFAKQFLVSTSILGYRLCQPGWTAPQSTAEALGLHLIKSAAAVQLDLSGISEELPLEEIFAAFNEHAFEDLDHELLFEAETEDGVKGLDFADWFTPRPHLAETLHPYLTGTDD
ncbi:hypothetical protein L3Q67_37495 [Saccharothrix sp. AJ9571]|nr:hypothetical protein L3Q67_37495 [Saccharothrix sp. AJ9571]